MVTACLKSTHRIHQASIDKHFQGAVNYQQTEAMRL